MKLGIPTLCRYDLLEELIKSAESGSRKPSGYVIVDNGRALDRGKIETILGDRAPLLYVVTPLSNIGVAASWNLILDLAKDEPIAISNDDIVFGERTFEGLENASRAWPLFGNDWALFTQTPACTDLVGYYDENFWPAYYEDSDYTVRMHRAGVARGQGLTGYRHHGHASSPESDGRGSAENRQYFRDKWNGRMLGEDPLDTFEEPWGGTPPHGWKLRFRSIER